MYLIPPDKGIDVDQRAKQERCSVKVKELWLAGVEGSLRCWEPDEKYAHLTRSRGDDMPLYLRPWSEELQASEETSGANVRFFMPFPLISQLTSTVTLPAGHNGR